MIVSGLETDLSGHEVWNDKERKEKVLKKPKHKNVIDRSKDNKQKMKKRKEMER